MVMIISPARHDLAAYTCPAERTQVTQGLSEKKMETIQHDTLFFIEVKDKHQVKYRIKVNVTLCPGPD